MSKDVIVALIGFGKTLQDDNVDHKTKLQVLQTLSEAPLTLSELSDSGVGRAVRSLKSAPGTVGTEARLLIGKWKQLLQDHVTKVNGTTTSSTKNGLLKCQKSPDENVNSIQTATYHQDSLETSHLPNPPSITQSGDLSSKVPSTSRTRCTHLHDQTERKMTPSSNEISPPTRTTNQNKATKRTSSSRPIDSLDSTSGLSFMESLNVTATVSVTKKKKTRRAGTSGNLETSSPIPPHHPSLHKPPTIFTESFLSSLSKDIGNRPDVIHPSTRTPAPVMTSSDPFDDDDGDLKFKSKKILWVPKPSTSRLSLNTPHHGDPYASSNSSSPIHMTTGTPGPASLVDLCVNVVGQNLSRVDEVGSVPYELLSRVLRRASAEDLARIESFNPSFVGCSDDLWKRHIKRLFPQVDPQSPRTSETWCEYFNRLSAEQSKRLDRIISKSAKKIREEQEARRITLPTEVITPRQVQRRAARQHNCNNKAVTSKHSHQSSSNSHHHSDPKPVFRPYNVSRPSANVPPPNAGHAPALPRTIVTDTKPKPKQNGGGGLLSKLRKQLHRR